MSTSKTGRIPQSHTLQWWIHVVWWASRLVPSGFSNPFMSGVCCSASVPSRVSVSVFSSRIKHNAFKRGQLLPSPSLASSQTWVSSTTRGRRFIQGDSLYYFIQLVKRKEWATWELFRGLGYSGSSLPSCPSLSLDNLLYREDFP